MSTETDKDKNSNELEQRIVKAMHEGLSLHGSITDTCFNMTGSMSNSLCATTAVSGRLFIKSLIWCKNGLARLIFSMQKKQVSWFETTTLKLLAEAGTEPGDNAVQQTKLSDIRLGTDSGISNEDRDAALFDAMSRLAEHVSALVTRLTNALSTLNQQSTSAKEK